MKAWQTILIVAAIATIIVIAGTFTYYNTLPTPNLRISSTTSLWDTGLLTEIKNQYESNHKVDISILPQGTGLALASASAGDADVVLVHAPSSEYPHLSNGTLVCRKIVAWNYFTIVGPNSDPAKISGKNATEALKSIVAYANNQTSQSTIWISRNDASGTFSKEQSLWKSAGFNWTQISKEPWYSSTGQGMGATLVITDQKNAYTVSDLGTYLQFSKNGAVSPSQVSLVQADYSLLNVYSIYAVNPQKISDNSYNEAINFIKWIVSDTGQQVISNYGAGNYTQTLFSGAVQPLIAGSPQPDVNWIKQYAYFNGTECPTQFQDDHPELYP